MTTDLLAKAFRVQELNGVIEGAIKRKYDCIKFLSGPCLKPSQLQALTNVFKSNDLQCIAARIELRRLSEEIQKQKD